MPQFSLVMPVYDQEAALASALACVYEQTLHDYELIVVDGGASGDALALLEREAEQGRLRLLPRADVEQAGQEARNHGAWQAGGRWLVFFDPGDLLLFDHLSQFADGILAHPHLELFLNAYQMMEDHQRLPRVAAPAPGVLSRHQALAALARNDFIHTNGACILRERFLSLGGFPDGRDHGRRDDVFWLRALCVLEAIHYDATVTSLCVLRRDTAENALVSLPGPTSWVAIREEGEALLGRCERHYLRAAVNRKLLSLASDKKRQGQPVWDELRTLRLAALRPSHLYQALALPLPSGKRWRERRR